jgi:HEAT repeat protein
MFLAVVVSAFIVSTHASAAAVAKSTATNRAELGREALAVLSQSTNDSDPEVRAAVAASWGSLGNRAAAPFLRRAINDANTDVRIAAAASMHKLGDIQGMLKLIDETKVPANAAAPTTPAQELKRMARDAARVRAVLKLAEVAGEGARTALKASYEDSEGEVRDAAAIALARLGEDYVGAPFLAAVRDPDEYVRASAARSLGLIGRDGRETLGRLAATDASVGVRSEACGALASFADPAASTILIAALKDKSARVRIAAVRALAKRNDPPSTAALKSLLEKAPPAELALIATAGLAERGEAVDLGLLDLTLGQGDPELKSLAVRALTAAKRPEAMDLLAKAVRTDASRRIRVEAAAAIIARLRRIEAEQ